MIAHTWDGSNYRSYINGYLNSTTATAGTWTASTKLYFGNYTSGAATTALYGNVAKLSGFKTVLSQATINALYNVGLFGHT